MATPAQHAVTLGRLTTYQIIVMAELDESWSEWDDRIHVDVVYREEGPPITII